MSLPRYAKYKDSGVPWLGELPLHWKVKRLKHLGEAIIGLTYNPAEVTDEEHGTLVLRSSNVQNGNVVFDDNVFVSSHIPDRLRTVKGDILICSRNGSRNLIGKNALITKEAEGMTFGAFMTIFRSPTNPYLYWVFNSQIFTYQSGTFLTSTINQLTVGNLEGFEIPVPPIGEQQAIKAFLDHETAKIDTMIADQEKLIVLLAEKLQATISRAVTEGLNPNALMKDSGVAWLGRVPAHWRILSLKHLVSAPITDGPHETPSFPDEGVPFVSAEAISGGFINFEKIRGYISPEDHQRYSEKYKPQLHDIYMVKSGATTGVTAIVESEAEFNIWSPLAAIRCDKQIAEPYFVLAALRSRNFQEGVVLNWSYGTQQNIGMGVIENLPIALPPLEEQHEIATYLALQIPKLNALSIEAKRAISLLKERRGALIAAAVTGQIDVQGLFCEALTERPEAIAA